MREKRIIDTWNCLDKAIERLMKAEQLGDIAKRNAWDNVNDQMRKLKRTLEIECPRPKRTPKRRKRRRKKKQKTFSQLCDDMIKGGYTYVDSTDDRMPWLLELGLVRIVREEDDYDPGQQSFIPVWAAQCKSKAEAIRVKRSPKLKQALTTAFHLGLKYAIKEAA